MIRVEKHGPVITLTRDGETFRMPASDAPRLIAAILVELGVVGTKWQQGYQLGIADGLLEGYQRRDREYIVSRLKAQREREIDQRRALLALAGDARTA